MPSRILAPAAAVLALALLAVSCASPREGGIRDRPAARPESPGTAGPSSTPMSGTEARDGGGDMDRPAKVPKELRFEAPALDGGTIRGAEFAGQDLVIWFWAPW